MKIGIKTGPQSEFGRKAREYEQQLGRRIDGFLLFPWDGDWNAVASGGNMPLEAQRVLDGLGHPYQPEWSQVLFPGSSSYDDALSGRGDDAMYRFGRTICEWQKSRIPSLREVMVRLGWEMNVGGYRWACADGDTSRGTERKFADVYRRWTTQLRRAAREVYGDERAMVMIWCPNSFAHSWDPFSCYPGDDVVDVIGCDLYSNIKYTHPDPVRQFEIIVHEKRFSTHHLFTEAIRRGKRRMLNEFGTGVDGDDNAPFIRKIWDYCLKMGVEYVCYWEEHSAYNGQLLFNEGGGSYPRRPRSWEEFKATFGAQPDVGPGEPPPPDPPPTGEPVLVKLPTAGAGFNERMPPGPAVVEFNNSGKGTVSGFNTSRHKLRARGCAAETVAVVPNHPWDGAAGDLVQFGAAGHVWLRGTSGMQKSAVELVDPPPPVTPDPPKPPEPPTPEPPDPPEPDDEKFDKKAYRAALAGLKEAIHELNTARDGLQDLLPDVRPGALRKALAELDAALADTKKYRDAVAAVRPAR